MPNNDPYPTSTTYGGSGSAGTTGYTPGSAGSRSEESIRERVSDMTQQAKDQASELGRKSADAIDRNLEAAAGKLESTADSIRMRAGAGESKVSQVATQAADKLDATARYFREHNARDMVGGIESLVRRNPEASLAAALAVGFLLGTALKRDKY